MRRLLGLMIATAGVTLLAGAPLSVATAAKHDKAVVVAHTYQVTMELAGHIHAVETNGPATNFCPGTDYTEDADFDLHVGGRIKVKLDGDATAASKIVIPGTDIGTWSAQGTGYPSNDCTVAAVPEKCEGDLALAKNGPNQNYLNAGGNKTKVAFSFNLQGPPEEVSKPSDCDQNTDISPGPAFELFTAIAPYKDSGITIPLVKLATATKFSGTPKPLQINKSYNVATCDGTPGCTATLTWKTRSFTVKQVK